MERLTTDQAIDGECAPELVTTLPSRPNWFLGALAAGLVAAPRAAERSESARKAVQARWARAKGKKKR